MIRRARPEDHARVTEIRNSVTENVLRDQGHRTATLTTQPGSRADRFYQVAGWTVIGTSERGERIFLGVL